MYKPGDLVKSNKTGSVYEVIDWKTVADSAFIVRAIRRGPDEWLSEGNAVLYFLTQSNMIPYNSKKLEKYM